MAAAPALTDSVELRRWLEETLGMCGLRITDSVSPGAGGWSNETHLLRVAGDDGAAQRLVLRLAPPGAAMFRDYDLNRQVACMRYLARYPACPVPGIPGADLAGEVLGRPFYLMEFIEGQVPADDRPTFFEAGFLHDASAAQQRHFHDGFIRVLADLHALPVDAALARVLEREVPGDTMLAREVRWLEDLYHWGRGPAPQPELERAFGWVVAHLPDDDRVCLQWGDARPANVVVRDFEPAALLDWELAALGPPELDLFWFLEMNHMRSNGRSLPGFPDVDGAIRDYQHRAGRPVRHAAFHRIHAALKVAVLMLRYLRVAVEHGRLPEHHPVLTDNTATRRLRELLT